MGRQLLPWKEVLALPLPVYESVYKHVYGNTSRHVWDDNFMGSNIPAMVRLDLQRANRNHRLLLQQQPYGQLHYTCMLEDGGERERGAILPLVAINRIDKTLRRVRLQKRLHAALPSS